MAIFVPDREGHDDYLISLALAARAALPTAVKRASGRGSATPAGDRG